MKYIHTAEGVVEVSRALAGCPWAGVDTEADSLHAYPEKVCLIQISTVAGDRLVDPLAPMNLDPLFAALNATQISSINIRKKSQLFLRDSEPLSL